MSELTQKDIEALMHGEASSPKTVGEDARLQPATATALYDFKKPNRVPAEQWATVKLIHKTYAQKLSLTLSSQLKTDVLITLESVEQRSFEEYMMSLVNPTCVASFAMRPLTGNGLLEINSALVYAFIDRMLGGNGTLPQSVRPFTDVELGIVRKLINISLVELGNAWRYILNISCTLQDLQTNPASVRSIPLREICVVITLKATIADTRGLITICIPYSNLEPLAPKLGNQQGHRYASKQSDDIRQAHRKNFGQVEVEVAALLGRLDIRVDDLISLQPGDILNLNHKTRDPIILRIAGEDKYYVNPGLIGKYKGVTIQKEIEKG